MLNPTPPPLYIIPSNLPRTRQGPDSRGIRLCFSELGRSCSLQTGYLIFTDGSAYDYGPGSNSEVEFMCDLLQRGRTFNFQVRRSRGGYVKGFTPPADYETIYSFPPYAGSAPMACPLPGINWNNLVWSVVQLNAGTPAATAAVVSTAMNGFDILANGAAPVSGGASQNPVVEVLGTMTYNGPMIASHLDAVAANIVLAGSLATVTIQQDGSTIAAGLTQDFTVGDTGGSSSTLTVDVIVVGLTGDSDLGQPSGGYELSGSVTPAS